MDGDGYRIIRSSFEPAVTVVAVVAAEAVPVAGVARALGAAVAVAAAGFRLESPWAVVLPA